MLPITASVSPVCGPGDPADAAHGHGVVILFPAAGSLQGPAEPRHRITRGAGRTRPAATHRHGRIADGRNRVLQQEQGKRTLRFYKCSVVQCARR